MKVGAVRNSDGLFINSAAFSEEARHFSKYGYYTSAPEGSPDWRDYWDLQTKRCLEGYTVGGAAVTGDHYFYLNFCPIMKATTDGAGIGKKEVDFPDFWDGDYNYFWCREIARRGILGALNVPLAERERILGLVDMGLEPDDAVRKAQTEQRDSVLLKYYEGLFMHFTPNGGKNLLGGLDMIVGKARRKGYSYKNGAIALKNLLLLRGSYTMFMAYEKKYLFPKGIFSMSMSYLSFINKNTAWTMPSDYIQRQDHIRNSYSEYINGVATEQGSMSEIQAISFKDNPDAGRGKDAYDIFGEEVGAWGTPGGLKASLAAMRPSVKAGEIKTGMITLFGTSGDIEGGTMDFASLHRNAYANEFMEFDDVWGDLENKKEGFFHPTHMNREGFYDDQGNSDLAGAKASLLRKRERDIENGLTSTELQMKIQEDPLTSTEAFALTSRNNFPVVELQKRLDVLNANHIQEKKGMPCDLYMDAGEIRIKYKMKGKHGAITSFRDLPSDRSGCVMVYEEPIPNAERGTYKIGYDPVRQDTGTSLAGIIVYKSSFSLYGQSKKIVAEYIGRKESTDDIDEIAAQLAMLYNTTVMHENEVTSVKSFFRRKKWLGLLAKQPDKVISKSHKSSRTARVYGCHMTTNLKDDGERYIKEWLIEVQDYDENGTPLTTIDYIESRRLLEELIGYNRDGNFDLVSALIMCMFQVQEESLEKEYGTEKKNDKLKAVMAMMDSR